MGKIVVYILTKNRRDNVVYTLSNVFYRKYFIVNYITMEDNIDISKRKQSRTRDDKDSKITEKLDVKNNTIIKRINSALRKSEKYHPSLHTIVIKDSSVCNVDADDLYSILKTSRKINNWDICYLCKWWDECDLYENIKMTHINGSESIELVKTYSPHGLQALMFSPHGRNRFLGIMPMVDGDYFTPIDEPLDKKLNKYINDEKLNAITYSKNIFSFNPSMIKKNEDLIKFTMCRPKRKHKDEALDIFLYITIVGITAIILICFHQLRKNL